MIELHLGKELFTPKYLPYIQDWSTRWMLNKGSAGSGKSYSCVQKIIIRCLQEPIRVLACRRYGTTIRQSIFSLFVEIIKKWKILKYVKINESDMRITFMSTGAQVIFTGLDSEEKLLSLNDISVVFIDEIEECSRDIVDQINLRMRGKAKNQQIIGCFNPVSINHWLKDFCEDNPPASFTYVTSTYKDNPFLKQEYIQALEELYIRNPKKARVYCDGEWGINTDDLVFTNWSVEELNPLELSKQFPRRCGMDVGFTDPSSIVETFYDQANGIIYITREFYKSGQTLDELYKALVDMNIKKVYYDSASPREGDYFRRMGIGALPSIKGAGSNEAKIAFLQNHRIIINKECINIISNFENFVYLRDKRTNKLTDKTDHDFSHGIDAVGYAYSDVYTKGRLRTLDKSVIGL